MKKTLLLAVAMYLLSTVAALAGISKFYVNPIKNDADLNSVVCNRLFQKGMLGMTKARQAEIATGDKTITTVSDYEYDYIISLVVSKAEIGEPVLDQVLSLGGLLGSKKDEKSDEEKEWQATITIDVSITNATTGEIVVSRQETATGTDKDKEYAYFLATDNFDYTMLDFIDEVVVVEGELIELKEVNKKNEVESIIVNVGFGDGLRKDLMFDIFDNNGNLIGKAKCDQITAEHEAVLSVYSSKKGDNKIFDAWQKKDSDEIKFAVKSRAKKDILHNMFAGLDKMFSKGERSDYMNPKADRQWKLTVCPFNLAIYDNAVSSSLDELKKVVCDGLKQVTTIEFRDKDYATVEAAESDDADGLVTVSIDKVIRKEETKTAKDGKKTTTYTTTLYVTMTGIDAWNNKWVSMKPIKAIGSSTDNTTKADKEALNSITKEVKLFAEDVFPVEGEIVLITDATKKKAAKEAQISIGEKIGVRKNMMFDLFLENKNVGAESRVELGTGKAKSVEGDTAIISIKGKKDGDEKIYQIINENEDENIHIIAVSRAYKGVAGFLNNLLQ